MSYSPATVGFAGDGLRGPGYYPTTTYVPFDLLPADAQATHWSAHGDAPELWNGNQLIDGGKHYGFMEVDVRPKGEYDYEVVMTPRYARKGGFQQIPKLALNADAAVASSAESAPQLPDGGHRADPSWPNAGLSDGFRRMLVFFYLAKPSMLTTALARLQEHP